jgi:hypothetical protein
MTNLKDCTQAFAEPGADSMIDLIDPTTGRSICCNENLEQIRLRYPTAEIVEVAHFLVQKAHRQDTPIEWTEVTEDQYEDMLNVLPPAFWERGLFLVGEPSDHHAISGRPRFAAYRQAGGKYFTASRPMMVGECRAFLESERASV